MDNFLKVVVFEDIKSNLETSTGTGSSTAMTDTNTFTNVPVVTKVTGWATQIDSLGTGNTQSNSLSQWTVSSDNSFDIRSSKCDDSKTSWSSCWMTSIVRTRSDSNNLSGFSSNSDE